MSSVSPEPLFPPHDAESSNAAAAGEPRLLTRRDQHVADPLSGQPPRHDLEARLNEATLKARPCAAETAPGQGLFAAVARLRRNQPDRAQAGAREPARHRKRCGAGRAWLLLVLGVVVLAGLFAAGLSAWLRHEMRAALPRIDGTLRVAGLHAPVRVARDAQGVPSITASNLDDLLFAQGFITAQDRLWQMDVLRRNAAGELAEVLGSRMIEHDRRQRFLQIRAAADRAIAHLAPLQLAQLEAYARGVNASISGSIEHPPIEFRLLHYRPAPWTPRDSLLLSLSMAQDLSTSFPRKLQREALAAHLAPSLIADLYPSGSWRDRPPTQPPVDLTAPRNVPEVPLDETQTGFAANTPLPAPRTSPADLLRVSAALRPCAECRAGSNNWAVAGSRSASGAPLLSNDMHLTLGAPDIWYETSLHLADSAAQAFDATGFALPGVPFIIVGRNAHVAWGFTNLGGDVQDLRLEHLRGSGPATEYQRADGSWAAVGHHPEVIRVRGGREVDVDVLTTTAPLGATSAGTAGIETPIISPLYPTERRALSLAWTVYDPSVLTSPFLGVNAAADGPSLVAALGSFGAPSLNLVWADSAGHIGFHAVGRIPIRGPALHHPRAVEPLVLPERVPAEDQRDESAPGEQPGPEPRGHLAPSLAPFLAPLDRLRRPPGAHWTDTAFHPARATTSSTPRTYPGRRRPAAPPARDDKRKTRPSSLARGAPLAPRTELPAQGLPGAQDRIAPAPAALDYTIGSPLSPLPVDSLDPGQQWTGYISFSDLPAAQDPAGGVLATANSRITADDYPYALALDWADPYRTERIYKLLEARHQLTPADLLAVQNDVHSELDLLIARRVAYAIDHASDAALGSGEARLRQAADLLRRWNGDMLANRAAPAIVATVRVNLLPMLIAAQVAAHDHLPADAPEAVALASLYSSGGSGTAIELLLQHTPAAWLPAGVANWNDLVASITARALEQSHAPRDLAAWTYGSIHPIEIGHPLFGAYAPLRWLLDVGGGSGSYPADGDASTIKAMARQHGPSERFTADLAPGGATLGNITTGESGNPASAWFMDQFLPWLRGTSFALPLRGPEAIHTLTLAP